METEKTDQQQFDEQVNKNGKIFLEIAAGVGVVAAVLMSLAALLVAANKTSTTTTVAAPAAAAKTAPTSVSAEISHVARGCHTLSVNGGTPSPNQTIRLAVGGVLHVQDNDVMPHQLMMVSGPTAQLAGAAMNHMGASSSVTFPSPGQYVLTTKAGEDYTKGVTTIGPDNTLKIKVLVA